MGFLSNVRIFLRLLRPWAIAALAFAASLVSNVEGKERKTWSRTISAEPANSADRLHELTLYDVEQNQYHLTGTWFYTNGRVGTESPRRVLIEGTRGANGLFWPDVTLQVRDESTGKWETVVSTRIAGRSSLAIEPNGHNFGLTVDLDPFKPRLNKYRAGRIVLSTGEKSEFELNDLLPPASD